MKVLYTFIIFVLLQAGALAQTTAILPTYVPPSPNAQTFSKYGEYPVSTYTGVPNIDIPLCSVNLKDISLPVQLTYNASGIKVNEEASRVGLGWALNAGGVISHLVRGRNDLIPNAYFKADQNFKVNDFTGIPYFSKYSMGSYYATIPFALPDMTREEFYLAFDCPECDGVDGEPDLFNYNFLGYSGKFIFARTGDVIKETEDNLMIKPVWRRRYDGNKELLYFVVVTPDGTKYTFGQTENVAFCDRPRENSYSSSFYLTNIQTVAGSNIDLKYNKNNSILGTYNRVEDTSLENDITVEYASYEVVYLEEISWSGGSVRFNYAFDRLDYAKEPRLSDIYFNDAKGTPQFRWQLIFDYFNANAPFNNDVPTLTRLNAVINQWANYYNEAWNSKRLKLTECRRSSPSSSYAYKFIYNESQLPTKLSASIDHWGYYNGANNLSLVPSQWQNISQQGGIEPQYLGRDANRENSSGYSAAFSLNTIIYPTGGRTSFSYEQNKYKTDNFENDQYKRDFMYSTKKVVLDEGVGWNNVPVDYVHPVSFSLPYTFENGNKALFNVRIKVVLDDSYNYRMEPKIKQLYMKVEGKSNGTLPWSFTYEAPYLPTTMDETNRTFEKTWTNVQADVGDYEIKVYGSLRTYIRSTQVEVSRIVYPNEYLASSPIGNGGGLRIKEIKNFDSNGIQTSAKRYYYTSDGSDDDLKTSGKLMFYPRYQKDERFLGSNGLREGSGYSVGYSKVFVSDVGSNGIENGRTAFDYINIPDKNLFYTWWDNQIPYGQGPRAKDINPPGVGGYRYSENGTATGETILKRIDNRLEIQKETAYTYQSKGDESDIYWGMKNLFSYIGVCFKGYPVDNPIVGFNSTERATRLFYPAIRPKKLLLVEKKETNYESGSPVQIVTNYTYDTKYNYKRSESTKGSNGAINHVAFVYPFDLSNNDSGMDSLVRQNRIADPVQVTYKSGETITSTRQDEYGFFLPNYKIPRLSLRKFDTGANHMMEPRIHYLNYDSYGNPLYIQKDGQQKAAFLWGYSGQYPVAEIKNASPNEIYSENFEDAYGFDANSTPDELIKHTGAKSAKIINNSSLEKVSHSNNWLQISLKEPRKFIYSGWVYSSDPSAEIFLFMKRSGETGYFSYVDAIGTVEKNRWVYLQKEFTVPADVTQLSLRLDNNGPGSVWFDDLRIHPSEAEVFTYSYRPLVGLTSAIDAKGKTIYYEYDEFQRLKQIKDANGKILKEFKYNFRQ